ncbi:MAG TPA: aminotransferase class III-fold pyridoxal phosphate-dependent enzyme, partial [Stellaceae bacterium]|nr:aminotransferase class III-fold pyridoxal phosphate-dependent enzyme [Stellaceae bacterium]
PYNDLAAMRAAIKPETAAILVEPVQGEGGLATGTPEYLKGLRALCDQHGILLVMDEVQSGMGRTGKLFAHEWAGITPDVLGTAKGLGGGFPVGAVMATERAATGMTPGTHGSTFGGNLLAMAAVNALLDVMLAPGFFDNVNRMAGLLRQRLEEVVASHPKIFAEQRGKGLLTGLRCVVPNVEIVEKLRWSGLITVGAGENVVRLLPPLIIGEQHVGEAVQILDKVAGQWKL